MKAIREEKEKKYAKFCNIFTCKYFSFHTNSNAVSKNAFNAFSDQLQRQKNACRKSI